MLAQWCDRDWRPCSEAALNAFPAGELSSDWRRLAAEFGVTCAGGTDAGGGGAGARGRHPVPDGLRAAAVQRGLQDRHQGPPPSLSLLLLPAQVPLLLWVAPCVLGLPHMRTAKASAALRHFTCCETFCTCSAANWTTSCGETAIAPQPDGERLRYKASLVLRRRS